MLMCLVAAVTLGRGSIVHAMDPDFASLVVTGDRSVECSRSQVKCDAHKAVVNHHHAACHGHKIGIPPADGGLIAASLPDAGFTAMLPALAADARPDAMIRPPKV